MKKYLAIGLAFFLLLPAILPAQDQPLINGSTSLDGAWSLATDPENMGCRQKWFSISLPGAKPTKVPSIIQEVFPAYHGVAWYARDFLAPVNPYPGGRYLLRFWQVDYLAEVWLNGIPAGRHEGGETPFVLDVTDQIKPGVANHLVVRVLNPTQEMIDGFCLNQTAHRCKRLPFSAGGSYNHGGITDSIELSCVPTVYVDDLYVTARPESKAGKLRVHAGVRNTTAAGRKGYVEITLSPARGGETTTVLRLDRRFPAGDDTVETDLTVDNPLPWDVNDPHLYRVNVRIGLDGANFFHEQSTRCGFRDFRFSDGYFRLNGKRIYLRCSHTVNNYPIGQQFPRDPDLARRDLLNLKVMGFNAVRFIWGGASRVQLDLCDEIGLLVYEESYAAWPIEPSPKMVERFDSAGSELIRRDRNHPSVAIWGLLNESPNGPAFQHALTMLPMIRQLDGARIVMLNSGRYDGAGGGSLSNPGSTIWEDVLSDRHVYPRVPHTADTIQLLRTLGAKGPPVFLSEYGIGSAVDLWRAIRHFEQCGAAELEDAQYVRGLLERFSNDWTRWRLDETFGRPEDIFMASLKKMAGQRTLGLNAIRSNPNIIAHSVTGAIDHVMCGEGLTTLFRELKPGTIDAMFDAWYPLRWCLFAEPVHVRRGGTIRLEAVLANEDALRSGDYPVLVQVFGPNGRHVLERRFKIAIPPPGGRREPSFAKSYFSDDVRVDGPSGKYRFTATFEQRAAAAGGETAFYVTDPAEMPAIEMEVVLWGDDPLLAAWLTEHGIRTRPFAADAPSKREVILVGTRPAAPGGAAAFAELARHIAAGSTAIFPAPEVFAAEPDQPTAWLPLVRKGTLAPIEGWLYLKDEWAKRHPIFDGLPSGGLMDYGYYREIIPDLVWQGQDPPVEAVAGAIKASQDYSSGLMVSVYNLGAGRFVLNTLRIRESLSGNPAAERLLRNMLRYAARDVEEPVASLPADFDRQLRAMGFLPRKKKTETVETYKNQET
ncbi:MAG: hypothetical protein JXB10_16770 [Pirellulales bacterium]|nr:hypothetical protein [Pirellulales bacterium]